MPDTTPPLEIPQTEFAAILDACRPRVGRYGWLWATLRARARRSRRMPWTLYRALSRWCDPRRPYFLGRTPEGVPFLGDWRDAYCVAAQASPDRADFLLTFLAAHPPAAGAYADVGANVGIMAAAVASRLRGRGVLAFEPVPETARRAAATFALNGVDNVRLFPIALGEADGELTLHSAPGRSNEATAHPFEAGWTPVRIPCRRLDGLREAGHVPPVGFLKVDAEGHDLSVLRGARGLIARDRPAILFEYCRRYARGAWTPPDATALITAQGAYDCRVLSGGGTLAAFPTAPADDPFTAWGEGTVNIFCESRPA